jgi:hypothetical protein
MKREDCYRLFESGTRILVRRCTSYSKHDYSGTFGRVVLNSYDAYGKILVDLDGETNPYSAHGYFYFKPYELEVVNDDNDILEENNMQNITNYLNIARIKYLDNNTPSRWDYANFDYALKVGDLCVVKSAHHGLGLARVTEIIDRNDLEVTREIVAKVDTELYDFRVKARKDAAELKAKMQERAKKLQDIALYQMLAKDDPEMQNMLEQYQSLPQY